MCVPAVEQVTKHFTDVRVNLGSSDLGLRLASDWVCEDVPWKD